MSSTGRIHGIRMPKWGLSMQEGTLVAWRVQPGDHIKAGAPLCDIETAKIANEFESPSGGVVARLLADPDEVISIGRLIAVIAEDGTTPEEIDAFVAREAAHASQAAAEDDGPQVRRLDLADGTVSYLEAGRGPGPSIVFLHGFGGSHAGWAMTQSALAEHHRTLAFDLPGHGGSSLGTGHSGSREMAGILEQALAALDLHRIHVVAHSFGGRVALDIIASNRGRFDSATFIAPLGFGSPVNPEYVRGFVESERKRDLKPVLELLFDDPAILSREMVNDSLRLLRDERSRSLLRAIAATMLEEPPGEAPPTALEGLRYQLIWGDHDRIIPMPPGLMTSLGSRLSIIKGSGHMPQLERSGEVDRLIAGFVRE